MKGIQKALLRSAMFTIVDVDIIVDGVASGHRINLLPGLVWPRVSGDRGREDWIMLMDPSESQDLEYNDL